MKAYIIEDGRLVQKEIAKPKVKNSNDVLIKVHAFAFNRADLLQMSGLYPSPDQSDISGLEVLGFLENGTRVSALLTSGGFAEYVVADKRHIIEIPEYLDDASAAAIPEAIVTCWLNLFKLGNLDGSKSILIHGATSGIGSTAIQIAKIYNKKIFGTVGSDKKIDLVKYKLGIENIYNYQLNKWVENIREEGGVNLVLDILGGKYLNQNISSLKKYGRLIQIAVMDSSKAELNLGSVLMKNITIIGSTLRSKSNDEKADIINEMKKSFLPKLWDAGFKPIVDSIYNYNEINQAIERLESREHFGKVVVFLN